MTEAQVPPPADSLAVSFEESDEQFREEEARRLRALEVASAFRPSAPVDQRDLLAGRTEQLETVFEVLRELGQHAVIYGERGVGKTSLSKVIAKVVNGFGTLSVYITCDGSDDYSSVWAKVFDEIRIERVTTGVGFRPEEQRSFDSIKDLTGGKYKPNDVRGLLKQLSQRQRLAIFLDEFDQIQDTKTRGLMADTVKTLSDQAVDATLVLVGVADSVDQLISEHQSVERALHQVLMPRLLSSELRQIVLRALRTHEMEIQESALAKIVALSQGLPHYTHLVGQYAAINAVLAERRVVLPEDVLEAVKRAISKTQQSTQALYLEAVSSAQKTLFAEVICACALAKRDELGYFSPADVRGPLGDILGRKVEMGNFVRHLNALTEDSRGPLLDVKGLSRRFRYRFTNPLMQPFVVMKGIADGLIDSNKI